VERAFEAHGRGLALPPGVLGMPVDGGGFHIKAGLLHLQRSYFAAKCNGNFFGNAARFGMPNIQGIVVLCDAENGYPLAVMDSIDITIKRTGAATAVAAKHLARPDASVITISGCGNQGRVSLEAISRVRRIHTAYAYDTDPTRAARYAEAMSRDLQIDVRAVTALDRAVASSHVVVTCTPSNRYYLERAWVSPGTFVAGVGADNEHKHELDPQLLASAKVVVDVLEQCATIGDLHHALESGAMQRADVHAELGEVIAGRRPGRQSSDEIIVFDSTGMALQDVAAAAVVYEAAGARDVGLRVDFFSSRDVVSRGD
jgi:ornithine cyclodeaminase/alanine dehydrogenase-like protein (mu-crystallin family)